MNLSSLVRKGRTTLPLTSSQVPPEEFQEDIFSDATVAEGNDSSNKTTEQNNKGEEKPKFGLPPEYDSPDFNFKRECELTSISVKYRGSTFRPKTTEKIYRVDL